jgi:hypothetical protein
MSLRDKLDAFKADRDHGLLLEVRNLTRLEIPNSGSGYGMNGPLLM